MSVKTLLDLPYEWRKLQSSWLRVWGPLSWNKKKLNFRTSTRDQRNDVLPVPKPLPPRDPKAVGQLKLLSGQTVVLINGTLPDYLNASLRKNSDAHSRTTRNHCNLNLLRPLHKNISMGTRTFAVRTVKDWNNLPRSLKTNKSLKSFKAELWKTLLNSWKTKGSFGIN